MVRRVVATVCASLVLATAPVVGAVRAGEAHTIPVAPPGAVHAPALAPSRLKFIGFLIVPRLKLRAPIYSGNTDAIFDVGLGHWPGTAIPGKPGNAVIGGHRTGGQMHFLNIHRLRKGDRISAKIGRKTFNYKVTGTRIVKPSATNIVKRSRDARITLYSCHPPHSIKYRYVVTAVLTK